VPQEGADDHVSENPGNSRGLLACGTIELIAPELFLEADSPAVAQGTSIAIRECDATAVSRFVRHEGGTFVTARVRHPHERSRGRPGGRRARREGVFELMLVRDCSPRSRTLGLEPECALKMLLKKAT
jgi:hypothetical protein